MQTAQQPQKDSGQNSQSSAPLGILTFDYAAKYHYFLLRDH